MMGLRAVTRIGFFSTRSAIWAVLTVKPAMALSARTWEAWVRRSIDWRRLWARTGSMTLSSKLPSWAEMVTVRSLPMTWAQTIITASGMTGLILPGMMEEPGWRAGR